MIYRDDNNFSFGNISCVILCVISILAINCFKRDKSRGKEVKDLMHVQSVTKVFFLQRERYGRNFSQNSIAFPIP